MLTVDCSRHLVQQQRMTCHWRLCCSRGLPELDSRHSVSLTDDNTTRSTGGILVDNWPNQPSSPHINKPAFFTTYQQFPVVSHNRVVLWRWQTVMMMMMMTTACGSDALTSAVTYGWRKIKRRRLGRRHRRQHTRRWRTNSTDLLVGVSHQSRHAASCVDTRQSSLVGRAQRRRVFSQSRWQCPPLFASTMLRSHAPCRAVVTTLPRRQLNFGVGRCQDQCVLFWSTRWRTVATAISLCCLLKVYS